MHFTFKSSTAAYKVSVVKHKSVYSSVSLKNTNGDKSQYDQTEECAYGLTRHHNNQTTQNTMPLMRAGLQLLMKENKYKNE